MTDINKLREISDSLNPKPPVKTFEEEVVSIFNEGLKRWEELAESYAEMGRRRVDVLVCESRQRIRLEDLNNETREAAKRLMDHFEGQGFKVYWHGPYVDGGPSKVYHGIDLVVEW